MKGLLPKAVGLSFVLKGNKVFINFLTFNW